MGALSAHLSIFFRKKVARVLIRIHSVQIKKNYENLSSRSRDYPGQTYTHIQAFFYRLLYKKKGGGGAKRPFVDFLRKKVALVLIRIYSVKKKL